MSITILEPSSGQEVTSPVTVVASYIFSNPFELTCKVGSVPSPESPEPLSGVSVDNTHTSMPTTVRPGVYTVVADGTNSAGGDAKPNVIVTGGKPPIHDVEIKNLKPIERGMKTVKLTGECNPRTKAAYVICRIIEVNLRTQTREVVAAGAGTTEGKKLAWKVVISFSARQAMSYQYVAEITAYNLEGQPKGQLTKFIKK